MMFDFHTHSHYSADSSMAPTQIIEEAEAKGLEGVAITDHGPELSVGMNPRELTNYLRELRALQKKAGIPVFVGMEVNIVDRYGNLDVPREILAELDYPLISIHYINESVPPNRLGEEYVNRLIKAIEKNRVRAVAHPFFLHRNLLSEISETSIEELLLLAAQKGVAIEINTKYHTPPDPFLRLCTHHGVKLSVGSDAHSPGEVGWVEWAFHKLSSLGVTRDELIISEL